MSARSLYVRSYVSASRPSIMKPIANYSFSCCLLLTTRGGHGNNRFIVGEDAPVEVTALQQLGVRTLVDQLSLAQHQDFIGPTYLRETMCNQQSRAPL